MMYYHDGGYGFGPFDFVFHIFGFVLIVALIVFALRFILGRPRRWRHMHMMGTSALDVLAERYAKGEIDKEEYEERKSVLSK